MDPESTLESLRQRHGVSEKFAQRFLPLVERAARTSPDVRQRILELVERSFLRQSQRRRPGAGGLDEILLDKVARVLHTWEPAPWLRRWSE